MRSFSKKLAFVLAAAMVVTAFAPAAKAEAAKEMAINKSSQILYVNEGINHKGGEVAAPGKGNVSVYDFSVKNKPADWKTALKFEWSSKDEDIVSVAKGGVATAVGVGKTTVYCKVTEKATGEVTTLKTKVTVKANAYDVEITNADKWDGATVEVNGVVDLNRAMYDEDGNKTTKRGTLVTDYTKWVAEPAAGVEIDQKTGKFTFTEAAVAGEYKLSCYTYQSSKYTEKTAESDVVVVEFVNGGFEVDQTASNGFNLLFNKAADVKIADVTVNKIIKVGDGTGKLPQVVSNVAMSEDKKTASVSLFTNFENGATYEVSVKGYDDVVSFVAAYGTPVSMTINSKSNIQGGAAVLVGDTPTELTYNLFDAEGNDVTNTVGGYVVFSAANTATADYYVDNGYLFILKEGTAAVVNAVYHSQEFDANAKEKTIEASNTFVGVTKAAENVKSVEFAVKYWGNNLSTVAVDLQTVDLEIKITTTKQGDWAQDYGNGGFIDNLAVNGVAPQVRYRSSNPDVLDVRGNQIDLFKEGTSAILVDLVTWNADGSENVNTIAATYVTVGAKCKVSNVVVANNASLTVGAETAFNTAEIQITTKDQYGFEWGLANWNDAAADGSSAAFKKVKFADGTVISDNNLKGSIWLSPRRGATNWKESLVVNGDALLADMVAAGYVSYDAEGNWVVNGRNVTSITKTVIVEAQANNPGDVKQDVSFVVNVTVKRPVGAEVMAVEATGTTSGNVARYNTPNNPWDNAEVQKDVTFKVVTRQNGVKTAELSLAGVKPANGVVASGSAVGDLYYTITRNNTDISGVSAVTNSGNALNVKYSTVDGANVVYKSDNKDLGAGAYTFSVYKVAYNEKTEKYYFAYVGASSANVTCDAGNYTYVKRLAEYVKADFSDEDLRNCFEINGLDGKKTTNGYSVNKTNSANFVHVNSITFYEPIADQGVNAMYTVNINVSLKK